MTRAFALLFALTLLAACAPAPRQATPPTARPAQVASLDAPTSAPPPTLAPTSARPTSAPLPSATPLPTQLPAPTATPVPGPPRVGLQVGHWKSNELPEELERLRTSAGAYAAGVWEWELNYDIARRAEALLLAEGVLVDVLPATVPPGYLADAFVSIHADGSPGSARGYKAATPWRTSRASQALLDAIDAEYGAATGLPRDGSITRNMRGYYAFSYRRHQHAIARTTPAVILEMGFLTSAADREVMLGQPDRVARGLVEGVLRYLRERDPGDVAALEPPDFPTLQAGPAGAEVLAAPEAGARVLAQIPAGRRVFAFAERDGWLQVTVGGQWDVVGWLPREAVELAPPQTPLPTEVPQDT
jgi:hypothetical protein